MYIPNIKMDDFKKDRQGCRFTDVLNDSRIDFQIVIDFFNEPDHVRRMLQSELCHERPPLAGVIKSFEYTPEIYSFFRDHDPKTTNRFKQAIGVLVRMHMEQQGMEKTGKKGSIGLSKYFTRGERYGRPKFKGFKPKKHWMRRMLQ